MEQQLSNDVAICTVNRNKYTKKILIIIYK